MSAIWYVVIAIVVIIVIAIIIYFVVINRPTTTINNGAGTGTNTGTGAGTGTTPDPGSLLPPGPGPGPIPAPVPPPGPTPTPVLPPGTIFNGQGVQLKLADSEYYMVASVYASRCSNANRVRITDNVPYSSVRTWRIDRIGAGGSVIQAGDRVTITSLASASDTQSLFGYDRTKLAFCDSDDNCSNVMTVLPGDSQYNNVSVWIIEVVNPGNSLNPPVQLNTYIRIRREGTRDYLARCQDTFVSYARVSNTDAAIWVLV